MIISRLDAEAQTTIPEAVRKALKLKAGDALAYAIEEGCVVLRRVDGDIFDNPFATFTEWDSEADHKAYDKL